MGLAGCRQIAESLLAVPVGRECDLIAQFYPPWSQQQRLPPLSPSPPSFAELGAILTTSSLKPSVLSRGSSWGFIVEADFPLLLVEVVKGNDCLFRQSVWGWGIQQLRLTTVKQSSAVPAQQQSPSSSLKCPASHFLKCYHHRGSE